MMMEEWWSREVRCEAGGVAGMWRLPVKPKVPKVPSERYNLGGMGVV